MAIQFRDTEFGHLVRFLSNNKLFRYPDEIDPQSWEKFGYRGTSSVPTDLEDHDASQVQSQELDDSAVASTSDPKIQNVAAQGPTMTRTVEDGKDAYLVDWHSTDDPENPQNWPSSWKLMVTLQICLLNFSVYIPSSIYVPGESSIMNDFDVSEIIATLGLSFYTIGYGLGPMLWSPMSEIPTLGRSGIYFWTLLFFVLLQLPTGFAVNMPMFLVFRLITGFVGSPSLATGGATIADMYIGARAAYGIAIWGAFGICGPVFGPIIGGFVAAAKGWRWTIWVVTWLNTFMVVMVFFCLPETSAANILYKRAKRAREATGDGRLRSQSEVDAAQHTKRDTLVLLARAFTFTFSEPIVFFMDLYTALLYGLFFIWFESFPLVFGDIYGFGVSHQGLAFLGIFVGGVVTVPLYLVWIKYGIIPKIIQPTFKPEMLLPPTFFGSVSLPICLFWYGWSARESIHWIMPIIGSSFFTVGLVTLFNAVFNYLGMIYPLYAASVFAGNALFRATFGAIFPLFARQLFRSLGIGPGNSLLGGIAICFLPLPYILYTYGEKIRRMSKNARHGS
ncbi:major facilitator superfamily domain-containing protein [Xylariales sp. AK1849]|nr:major facilitator superfamily domain-containing protein [Xylariales sp. AK1849]